MNWFAAVRMVAGLVAVGARSQSWAADWPPITSEELAMTDDPSNPGASAILLDREVSAHDVKGVETEYRRIKIFTEEGLKFADIQIPYVV